MIAKEAVQTGLVKKENLEMWVHRAQHAHVEVLSSSRFGEA